MQILLCLLILGLVYAQRADLIQDYMNDATNAYIGYLY